MPDASFANRRPPTITPERRLYPKHAVSAFAIHGRYAISATTHVRIWDTWTGETTGIVTLQGEHKVVAVEFVFTDGERGVDGRIAWAGTKDGKLFEIDIQTQQVLETKSSAHSSPVSVIYRASGNKVVTVCESGKVQIWSNEADPGSAPSLSSTPRTQRLGDKHCYLKCFGEQLWSCHGPVQQSSISSHLSSKAARSPTIRVYDVGAQGVGNLTTRAMHTLDNGCPVGQVMAGATIPCEPNLVYLAHETGHISKWDRTALECIDVVRVSPYAITALEGVNDMLWAGNREGTIYVYDTRYTPWKVVKAWKAADEPVCGLQVDLATLGTSNMLHVASYGRENLVMWDGLLEVDWLEHSMLKRQPEYSSYRDIKVFIFSWNIDSSKPSDLQNDAQSINCLSDALQSSLQGAAYRVEPPEIVVFGLQEVVDLENKKLTAKNMLLGRKKADAMFQDQVSHQYMRWHDRLVQAVRTAMPADSPYYLQHAENLVGLQTLIFVKTCEKPNVSDAAKISVKTGMGGRYGNKGAILARFVIDDSSICFLNCHLAAGQRATRQRNKDLVNILENKAAFLHPSAALPGVYIGGNGQTVFEHEICFLSGDLNYRISLTRSIVTANIRSSNLKLLLDHDQLAKEMKTNQAFRLRSFREADINFLPTYKFDPGTDNYDSSAKERIPAWCDRILYRVHEPSVKSEKIRPLEYRSWSATPSDHKPISGLYSVRIKKMDREKRQRVRDELEAAWSARAKDILIDAKRFHGLVQKRTIRQ
ncbi:DNase I-like protein [Cystobasidium minutum MCA 4210]|uniref:DNase I-like protein n=1 Tax=Cystobasidium minutum MCA 4210 TaxID=1397322 RepID=UPI0034CF9FE4|eukprot:jgi/Rhomi1/163218/estExt_Genewise1Plus.C_7_t10257